MSTLLPLLRSFETGTTSRLRGTTTTTVPYLSSSAYLSRLSQPPSHEYTVWNTNSYGNAQAVPPFCISFSRYLYNGHALLIADEEGILTILNTCHSLREQMSPTYHAPPVGPLHPPRYPPGHPFWKSSRRLRSLPARFRAHDNAIFDAVFLRNDTCIATASGDASVRLFDVETTLRLSAFRAGQASVKAVRPLPRCEWVLAAGSRDGHIRVFDARVAVSSDPSSFANPVMGIEDAHPIPKRSGRRGLVEQEGAAVTSLAFLSSNHLLSSGADGKMKVWDMRRLPGAPAGMHAKDACIHTMIPPPLRGRSHGISHVSVSANGTRALACTKDSTIHVYDVHDMTLGRTHALVGHMSTSFYIRAKFSRCARYVASGSVDSKVYIWDLEECTAARSMEMGGTQQEEGCIAQYCLEGHSGGEAADVSWCPSEHFKLASCGDDSTVRVWNVNSDVNQVNVGGFATRVVPREGMRGRGAGGEERRLRDSDIRMFFGA